MVASNHHNCKQHYTQRVHACSHKPQLGTAGRQHYNDLPISPSIKLCRNSRTHPSCAHTPSPTHCKQPRRWCHPVRAEGSIEYAVTGVLQFVVKGLLVLYDLQMRFSSVYCNMLGASVGRCSSLGVV